MTTRAPVSKPATVVALGASAAILAAASLSGGSVVAGLPALAPLVMAVAVASGWMPLTSTAAIRPAMLVTAAAGALSIILGDGSWVIPAASVIPVAALAAALLDLVDVVVAQAPTTIAGLVVASGTDRIEVVGLAVAGVAGAQVVSRAGRWLADGAQQTTRRLSELGNLLRAADVLAALDDDDRAAATISELCRELVGADAVALLARSDLGGTVVASRDLEELLPSAADPALNGLAARAIARNVPSVEEPPEMHAQVGVQWLMVVPLQGTTASMGAVVLAFSSPPPGDSETAELCAIGERFAHQAGLTLERIRSLQRVAAAALRDPLTGVGNRRALESVLAQLRPGDAVALFDLDHFKGVNDTYGHSEGDKVLVAFAGHLRRSTPHDAVVGRWGGEEFIVVLRAAHHRAGLLIEEVRAGWEADGLRTTCSGGVSLWHRGHDLDDFIEEVDEALYAAKRSGRNRIMSWDEDLFVCETHDSPVTAAHGSETAAEGPVEH